MTDNLSSSFKKTILKSDLSLVIQNAGEIGFDSLLDNGVLKDIPLLNTLFSLGKTVSNVRDYFFAKKILVFLESISNLSETERNKLVAKLDADEKFGRYAGEQLIELLSRIDSEKKAVLAASALKLYACDRVTSSQLQRINNAIDRFMLCDLNELRSFCAVNGGQQTDGNPITANFINAGLAYVSSGLGGGTYPNETAHLFLQVIDERRQ